MGHHVLSALDKHESSTLAQAWAQDPWSLMSSSKAGPRCHEGLIAHIARMVPSYTTALLAAWHTMCLRTPMHYGFECSLNTCSTSISENPVSQSSIIQPPGLKSGDLWKRHIEKIRIGLCWPYDACPLSSVFSFDLSFSYSPSHLIFPFPFSLTLSLSVHPLLLSLFCLSTFLLYSLPSTHIYSCSDGWFWHAIIRNVVGHSRSIHCSCIEIQKIKWKLHYITLC